MQVQLPLAVVGQVVGALRSATVVPVLIWLPVQVPPDVIVVDIDPVAPALATATSASSTVMLPGDALDTVPRSVIPVGAVHAIPGEGELLAAPSGGSPAALTDAALARFAAVGDGDACRARLDEYRAAGLRSIVLLPRAMRALHGGDGRGEATR